MSRWILSNWALDATGPNAAGPKQGQRLLPVRQPPGHRDGLGKAGRWAPASATARYSLTAVEHHRGNPPATFPAKESSSRTMLGLFPPSSWVTRLTVGAALRATSMPALVDPVKDTMSMPGWLDSAAPTPGPSPCTML